ncbi:phosphatidate cytidylyltransferase [Atopomonas sediminilitoris]|uniref:phosphatidate cytidylyltransferase n=1 Tax=Atopomonas sediminilitoris TaxID=2919919 RepID=UPI001F4EFF47|nr:phosphatidate cytidylyltransferase [Atopomonas sediminilitoris]MCJ8169738.1 phosphatidate cytidylyltransferase [Atopomonas sediminilitoris]
MLKQRIITALILAPLALAGFFMLYGVKFALFITAVVMIAAWEWARLAGCVAQWQRVLYAALIGGAIYELWWHPQWAQQVLLWSAAWWALAVFLVAFFPRMGRVWQGRPQGLLIGFFVLLPAWQGLQILKGWPQGNALILAVMILVWGADVGAYFAGKAFGKRKLAPAVSPGKSWEGLFGGLALTLLIAAGVGFYREVDSESLLLMLCGTAVVVLFSVVGDLNESMFKRHTGIKDSSNLLPGHGGVMDRIDSLTAAIPVFTLLLWVSEWGPL